MRGYGRSTPTNHFPALAHTLLSKEKYNTQIGYQILLIINLVMGKTTPNLIPRVSRLLNEVGMHLKLARLRRKYSSETVAQRAGITRRTLSKVEQGDPGVALGVYARVMQVLRLEGDLALLGADDELGRKLQDAGITPKLRAPKRTSAATVDTAQGRH
jgi:transcriptional regulator with XRE-family HTH domain